MMGCEEEFAMGVKCDVVIRIDLFKFVFEFVESILINIQCWIFNNYYTNLFPKYSYNSITIHIIILLHTPSYCPCPYYPPLMLLNPSSSLQCALPEWWSLHKLE